MTVPTNHPGATSTTRDTQKIRSWMSDQVPGGRVKLEMNDEGFSPQSHLVEFVAKFGLAGNCS